MPTAADTATKPTPAAAKSAPASVARKAAPRHEAAAAPVPEKPNRPVYSPLGFKLFYHDDPNFVMTNEYINRVLYGEP
jgi:hypothetical protein